MGRHPKTFTQAAILAALALGLLLPDSKLAD
jgi:hypothetical protein